MAFKMNYSKKGFPFKKADKTLVEGAKDSVESIFNESDKAKAGAMSDIISGVAPILKEKKDLNEDVPFGD